MWAPLLQGIVSYYVNVNIIDDNILCFDANITFITSKFSYDNSTDRLANIRWGDLRAARPFLVPPHHSV